MNSLSIANQLLVWCARIFWRSGFFVTVSIHRRVFAICGICSIWQETKKQNTNALKLGNYVSKFRTVQSFVIYWWCPTNPERTWRPFWHKQCLRHPIWRRLRHRKTNLLAPFEERERVFMGNHSFKLNFLWKVLYEDYFQSQVHRWKRCRWRAGLRAQTDFWLLFYAAEGWVMGHFWSLAHPFMWKWDFHYMQIFSFLYEWLCTRPRFDREVWDSSEIAITFFSSFTPSIGARGREKFAHTHLCSWMERY